MKRAFYIDPQSYNNLSVYDFNLLSHVRDWGVTYFHNVKYQLAEMPCADWRAVFSYSDKRGVMKALSYTVSLIKIIWQVWREHPDVVHIQWFRLFAVDSLFVLFLRRIGIKIVFTAHNVVPHNATGGDIKHCAWYYSHVDAVIVHTERSRDELRERFAVPGGKICVIPHGLIPSMVDETEVNERSKALAKLYHTEGKIIFAAMGYQNYYKGIDIVSDVWCGNAELRDNDRVMLFVVGKVQNADLSALKECGNVVVVDATVPDVDFDAYLRLTSVALLPYRTISQSGVLLTCLQRGVPVVVSDVGGLTDPLTYADVGWDIGEATAENLARMLLRLVRQPELITDVKRNRDAFELLRKVYSWETIAEKTAELYSRLVD